MKFSESQATSISKALEGNMTAKFAYLPRLVNASRVTTNGLTLIDSGHSCDMFNIVCCTTTQKRDLLQAAVNHFTSQNRPFAWWVGFQDEPQDLDNHLKTIGLARTENELGMAIFLTDLQKKTHHSELEIKMVEDKVALEHFISVLVQLLPKESAEIESFYRESSHLILGDRSKLQLFVGYLAGSPISTSALFCDSGVAGVWDVITLPQARGKGVGTEMTFAALQEGKKRGFEVGVLTASDEGQPVYRKLGFQALQPFYVYTASN